MYVVCKIPWYNLSIKCGYYHNSVSTCLEDDGGHREKLVNLFFFPLPGEFLPVLFPKI